MGKPTIPDIATIIAAGFDPKTGLPYRLGSCDAKKGEIKKAIRIIDEQDACNRFKWTNLPCNLTSQELERMLYYKGQVCFFYFESMDEYFITPFALSGTIDFYGRYNTIHPVPWSTGTEDDKKRQKAASELLSKINLEVVKTINANNVEGESKGKTVILRDYTKQLSENIIPRQMINDPIIDVESECIPFMATALVAGTGVKGVRVADADQASNVVVASQSMKTSALNGTPWIPVVGAIEFQEITDGSVTAASEFMLAMQSLDNFRLSTYGLENGGLFEKQAHELESENAMNASTTGLVMEDSLTIRKEFCELVNKVFGLSISVEINESSQQALIGSPSSFTDTSSKNTTVNNYGGSKNAD